MGWEPACLFFCFQRIREVVQNISAREKEEIERRAEKKMLGEHRADALATATPFATGHPCTSMELFSLAGPGNA